MPLPMTTAPRQSAVRPEACPEDGLDFDGRCLRRGAGGCGPDDRASGTVADRPGAADKNRIALAPAFAHNSPMLARVLSAALSRHSLPLWETTAEVNGIEAIPRRGGGEGLHMAEAKAQESVKRALEIAAAGATTRLCCIQLTCRQNIHFFQKNCSRFPCC